MFKKAQSHISMVAHACNLNTWKQRSENQRFQVILGLIVSLTPASGTGDPVPNKASNRARVLIEDPSETQGDTPIPNTQPDTLKRVLCEYHLTDPGKGA